MSTSLARTNFVFGDAPTPPDSPSSHEKAKDLLTPSDSAHDLATGATTPGTGEPDLAFTAAEEARVRWKLDLTVLPLVFIGFYVFQLERGNVSNALTDGFLKDVGITQDEFNYGQALLYLGIILLEIPSNYVLQWLGPQVWISFQVLAFGLVATFQAFQKGYGQFLGTRILLGVTECGYIPGSLYLISTFYKRDELAKRNSFFFLGSGLASATSGLLAYGILPLGRKYPQLHGWQYLMIIEGLMAVFIAIVFICFLPASPSSPHPMFLPIRYFTERERQILVARVVQDDKAKAVVAKRLHFKEIIGALGNWRKYPHVVVAISLIAQTSALGTYTPTLIKGFSFDTLTANALSSVAGWLGLIAIFAMGYISDKTRARGLTVIFAISILWIWWIVFQQNSLSSNSWLKYAFLVLTAGFGQAYHPVNATWLSLNCKTPQDRSVSMAMFIMAANCGALVGSQLLRGDDAPLYRRGFKVCVALTSFGLLVAVLQHLQYRYSNWRLDRRTRAVDGEAAQEPSPASRWRYTN